MSGNLLDKQELPVEYLSGIRIVDNYLIGDNSTEKGKYIFKVFDIENELTEVDIKLTECIYYSQTHYSCGEEYISAALDDKSYFRASLKTPFEKKQLCTTSISSTSLGVRKHAFGRFPFSCYTYLLFL